MAYLILKCVNKKYYNLSDVKIKSLYQDINDKTISCTGYGCFLSITFEIYFIFPWYLLFNINWDGGVDSVLINKF